MSKNRKILPSFAVVALLVVLNLPAALHAQGQSLFSAKEEDLIAVLKNGAPEEKALACKQLAVVGTQAAVPDLAPLLADEQLASWARIALEAIPDAAADEALRAAVDTLQGKLLVGVINSIGVRRDEAAVDQLTARLKDQDVEVAAAAAVALGRIGNEGATTALRAALADATDAHVRSSIAEGSILCAEQLMNDEKLAEAAALYDEIRAADLPKQRIVEATRGAILARRTDGIPLLIEQLRSDDRQLVQIGLMVARELPGNEVAEALAAELPDATPERAALLLYALADRKDTVVPPAVLDTARNGDRQVRIAAIEFVGRSGDVASLDTLLQVATESDPEISETAKAALAGLPGDQVNAEISQLLPNAEGKALSVLIEVVGLRRIDATDALIKALSNSDKDIRSSALTALGTTVPQEKLSVLVDQVVSPKHPEDAEVASRALTEAAVRMPDREAAAQLIVKSMSRASTAAKNSLLETLGAMGGEAALEAMAAAVKGNQTPLQDTGSRLLGEWMSIDAGPVLLDLAKTSSSDKYRGRAIRGYIRLARQFKMDDQQRAVMCQNALKAAKRTDEQKLVLVVLERYPSVDTLKIAVDATSIAGLQEDAKKTALQIVQKLPGQLNDAQDLLKKLGLKTGKVEIIKAEYGAGDKQVDVTEILRKQVGDLPLIGLPAETYNESFGGDPAQGVQKQLKVQYKLDGKTGEATFAENEVILLPTP